MANDTVNWKALGIALSGAMILITLLCGFAAMLLPGYQATHNWLNLVATGEPGSLRNLVEAIFNGLVVSWIAAGAFAWLYNRFKEI